MFQEKQKGKHMTPMDLKTKEEWEMILERVARDLNMTACLTDDTGVPFFCRLDRYPVCSAIRANPEATTFICSAINSAMLAVVKKTLQPEVDMCDVGLLRVVVPIVRDGILVGLVTACGLASKDEELNTFLVAKQLGVSEERVQELARPTPFGSGDEVERLGERLFDELNPNRG